MTRQFKTQETNYKSTEAPPYDGNPWIGAAPPTKSDRTRAAQRIAHVQYVPRRQTVLLAMLHALALNSCQRKSRPTIVLAVSGTGKTHLGSRGNQQS